jgi:hypothetical protein
MFPPITLLSAAGVCDLGSVERCPLDSGDSAPRNGLCFDATALPVGTGNRSPLSFSTPELGKAANRRKPRHADDAAERCSAMKFGMSIGRYN